MKAALKRLFSLIMVLVLLGSVLPAASADGEAAPTELTEADYAIVDDVFAQIDAMEDAPAKKNATQNQLTDAAAQIVTASENYVEGSLDRNGNSFTWWTDEGIRCIYSPRMRQISSNMVAPEEPLADGAYNEPLATKGGWPSTNQVYLIGPYYGYDSNFSNQYKNEAASIASAIGDTDGYTLYSGKAATVDKIAEAMSNGAVVIFDSHGDTDYVNPNDEYDFVTGATSSYLCLKVTTGLTDEDYNDGALYYSDGICINGATIANHMTKQSPAGLLWMAICLGMATDSFSTPMREMGVEVVYGYSQSITFDGDYLWEEIFWDNLCAGTTVATAVADMKSKCGEWDYCTKMYNYAGWSADEYGPISSISEAREWYYAFPVVVSDEDTHPGQRKGSFYGADSLQTVKSTYTLFSQYDVTAKSNNTSYGTVSVSGSTITAVPAQGYFAQSATVVSGSATVTQNGNSFSVNAGSDCTVQINFAPKTPVTVSFSGASVPAQSGYSGDLMALPTATAPEGFTFLGWTAAPLSSDTSEKPSFYTDSFTPTASTTLYALYSYVDETTGSGSGDYVKVTSTPDDWSGEYVIVYEADGYIFDGSLTSFDSTSNYQEVTISNDTISADEADAYKFTIAAEGSGYSIQGASGNYIGQNANSNGLSTANYALVNTLSLDAVGNANIIGSGGAYLRFNATSGQWRFRYYKSSSYENQKPIALYRKDGAQGVTYYTGNPIQCSHANTSAVEETAPTCTAPGYSAGVQCADCGLFISGHEAIDALGHSWSSWTETTAPTCTAAGTNSRTCSRCGQTETQSVAATGHSYANGACSLCGEAEPAISGTRYYIAALRNDYVFYMTSDLGSGSTSRYQAVDTDLTALPESITDPADGYVFILTENEDGTFSLQAEGIEGNNYLGHSSGNSGTLVAEGSALKLTMAENSDGTYSFSYKASDATRYLSLNGTAGNNYFAWYKSGQISDLYLIPVVSAAEPEDTQPEESAPEDTLPEEEDSVVKSWNVTLSDDISLKFLVNMNEGDTLAVTVNGSAVAAEPVANADGTYTVTVQLAPVQMNDDVAICVNGAAPTKAYSVKKYAETVLSGSFSDETKNLVKYMLVYGGAAQSYFGYKTDALASSGISVTAKTPVGTAAATVTGALDGITYVGASLVHRNKTAVRFYFTGNMDGVTFSQGTPVQKGDMYYIEVSGINPQDLGNTISLVLSKGDDTLTVGYSPLTYIIRMYNKSQSSAATKALVQALYGYYLAAAEYTN